MRTSTAVPFPGDGGDDLASTGAPQLGRPCSHLSVAGLADDGSVTARLETSSLSALPPAAGSSHAGPSVIITGSASMKLKSSSLAK